MSNYNPRCFNQGYNYPLAHPVNFRAENVTPTSLILLWEEINPLPLYCTIRQRDEFNPEFFDLGTTTESFFFVSDLLPGVTYQFLNEARVATGWFITTTTVTTPLYSPRFSYPPRPYCGYPKGTAW